MNAATFDTHEFIKTLEEAGVSKAQAEATAVAFKNAQGQSELATKADINVLRAEVKGELLLVKWMLALVIVVNALPILKNLFV